MRTISLLLLLSVSISPIFSQVTNVSTATELQNAINVAVPGETIVMADGEYIRSGGFYVNPGVNGTVSQPITLKGSSKVVLSTGSINSSYGFALRGNDYWVLEDFTVRNSKKGIMLDSSDHNVLKNLIVRKVGEEGIHFRAHSSYNVLENSFIDSTGLVNAGYGEAIYIGSANSNWSNYTNGDPDTSNYNEIKNNTFGDEVTAENIDIKEGTTGGKIFNNQFNGKGLTGANYADSWIDVKGNSYTINCNTGNNTMKNGFETHIQLSGWGDHNTFYGNDLNVDPSGYAIWVQTSGSKGTANGNIVCNDNTVNSGTKGVSNVSQTNCAVNCVVTGFDTPETNSFHFYPNPAVNTLRFSRKERYQIFDLTGKMVNEGNTNVVDVTSLESGIYFIRISDFTVHSFVKK